jgi:hypothetical protein
MTRSVRLGLVRAVIGIGLLLLFAAASSDAQDKSKPMKPAPLDPVSPVGKPKAFGPGKTARYGLWYEDGTWHLRTTAKKGHRFSGGVRVEGGEFTRLEPVKLDMEGTGADRFAWNAARNEIRFDFRTGGSVDGFDFKVDKQATLIRFALGIDGDDRPNAIFVGRKGAHPAVVPFSLPAHPR